MAEITAVEHPLFSKRLLSDEILTFLSNLSYDEGFDKLYDHLSGMKSEVDFEEKQKELELFYTKLDEDPTEVGLRSLHNKLSSVQNQKDNLARMMIGINRFLFRWEAVHFCVNKFYEHNKNASLSLPEVVEMKNQELRLAAVDRKIPKIVEAKMLCEAQLSKIKGFLKQCDIMFNNLKSTNENLSRQITVIQQQIDIGDIVRKH